MDTKPITWTRKSEKYENGYVGRIEHITIGEVNWDSFRSKNQKDDLYWVGTFTLPGYKPSPVKYATPEEAQHWIETRFRVWVDKIKA